MICSVVNSSLHPFLLLSVLQSRSQISTKPFPVRTLPTLAARRNAPLQSFQSLTDSSRALIFRQLPSFQSPPNSSHKKRGVCFLALFPNLALVSARSSFKT